MNVSELYTLVEWIGKEIVATKVLEKYQGLQKALQINQQQNQKQPFEQQKEALILTIENINLAGLTNEQVDFLEKLDILPYIGAKGVGLVQDILYVNAIDIATAAKRIGDIAKSLTGGINKVNQIKAGLEGCVEPQAVARDEILLRVTFTREAALANIADFKKWGVLWYEISRGIAMAQDAPPETVVIVGARKGSIVLDLHVAYEFAVTASLIVYGALQLADKVLDIRKKAEEIRGLKLSNKKIAGELDKEAEKERENGIKAISVNVVNKIGLEGNADGEKINALNRSIKELVEFLELGGEVDSIIPEADQLTPDTPDDQRQLLQQLKDRFIEIRRLEGRLKQLEPGDSNQDEEK